MTVLLRESTTMIGGQTFADVAGMHIMSSMHTAMNFRHVFFTKTHFLIIQWQTLHVPFEQPLNFQLLLTTEYLSQCIISEAVTILQ